MVRESCVCIFFFRYKVMKNWGVISGIAAALAAGIYVIWGPITERKKRRKGKGATASWSVDLMGHVLFSCIFKMRTSASEIVLLH